MKIAIAVDDLFFGLMASYTWTIGVFDLLFFVVDRFFCVFFVWVFLRLFLVPSVVFVAVFSHAGGRLSSQRNFKTCHHSCMLRFSMQHGHKLHYSLFRKSKLLAYVNSKYTRHTAHAYRFYFFSKRSLSLV